jgi:hypothetical protein
MRSDQYEQVLQRRIYSSAIKIEICKAPKEKAGIDRINPGQNAVSVFGGQIKEPA